MKKQMIIMLMSLLVITLFTPIYIQAMDNGKQEKQQGVAQRSYYEILGIGKNASTDEVSKAYRQLALIHHPDRNPNDQEAAGKKMQELNQVYGVLSDESKRNLYDQVGRAQYEELVARVHAGSQNAGDLNKKVDELLAKYRYDKLDRALFDCEDVSIVKALIRLNADLTYTDKCKRTALMHAVLNNFTEKALLLLDAKASPHVSDKYGYEILQSAAMGNNERIVRALLHAASHSRASLSSALLSAAHKDDTPYQRTNYTVLKNLLNAKADIDMGNLHTRPLIVAAQGGNLQLVNFLLNEKACIDRFNGFGQTALIQSVISNQEEVLECLLGAKADVHLQDNDGNTALMHAGKRSRTKMVENLIAAGARVGEVEVLGDIKTEKIKDIFLKEGVHIDDDSWKALKSRFKKTLAEKHVQAKIDLVSALTRDVEPVLSNGSPRRSVFPFPTEGGQIGVHKFIADLVYGDNSNELGSINAMQENKRLERRARQIPILQDAHSLLSNASSSSSSSSSMAGKRSGRDELSESQPEVIKKSRSMASSSSSSSSSHDDSDEMDDWKTDT
ncbi:MAG: ankyrin repeat domain-containing protein, partial [Candidatus Dependentiae bacterium]|nr:ankyrin repeat domain-containing protein [Candidatus Dependentiae bacterium]